MGQNLISVCTAAFGEFDSLWATVHGARAAYGEDWDLVVVDNAPEGCKRTAATTRAAGGRYVHRPDLNGTSRPRDACFQFATTPWVIVCDAHVQFEAGALAAAAAYARAHPDSNDILTGPLVADDGRLVWTRWNPEPTAPTGLWGGWGTDPHFAAAWGNPYAPGGRDPDWDYAAARRRVDALPPFEIPMMGLGLFMMRRAAWPGFHRLMRGFGGEEGYIHEKVRQLGGKALCLPALRWRHKFRDIEGWDKNPVPYPMDNADHVRNLLIGHRELGVVGYEDLIRDKFGKKIDPGQYAAIAAEVREKVEFGTIEPVPQRQRLCAIWYSNNSAPEHLLRKSLESIKTAADQSRHQVDVVTVPWAPVPGNPFPQILAAYRDGPGHLNIVRQIRQGLAQYRTRHGITGPDFEHRMPAAVCFLEHDVLYTPGYFDRVGDAFARNPSAPVVSHLDYIGLNATGWLGVRERHEPLHQLAVRTPVALANLDRAEAEAVASGSCVLEPDSAPDRRVFPQYAEVRPGLWIGAFVHTPPPGVTAVLNLSGVDDGAFADPYADNPRITHSHQPITDHAGKPAPPLGWLAAQVDWVAAQVGQNKGVFVHCLGGVSRSGLVVTAYLMKTYGVGRDAALAYIRQIRPQVAPRAAFWDLLAAYAETLPEPIRTAVPAGGDRSTWVRIPPDGFAPSVHCNHLNGRTTSHGEVVFEQSSTLGTRHRYWGDHKDYWPHPLAAPAPVVGCGGCGASQPTPAASLADWYAAVKAHPSDFHEHVDTLRDLASKCGSVTQIGSWNKPSRVAMAAGLPAGGTFTDHSDLGRSEWRDLTHFLGDRFAGRVFLREADVEIGETDLLFHDTRHQAEVVYAALVRHAPKVKKYIVVHTAVTFGEAGDDGGPGVMPGVRRFLRENQEWIVLRHDENNHGLIVLSRDPADRPAVTQGVRSVLRFVRAKLKHKLNGGTYLPLPLANERIDTCLTCPKRAGDGGGNCRVCRCFLFQVPADMPVTGGQPGKTFLPTESCPVGHWHAQPDAGVAMTPDEIETMLDTAFPDPGADA